jgi:hypothetical protein
MVPAPLSRSRTPSEFRSPEDVGARAGNRAKPARLSAEASTLPRASRKVRSPGALKRPVNGGLDGGGVVAADVLGERAVLGRVDGVLDGPVAACPGCGTVA